MPDDTYTPDDSTIHLTYSTADLDRFIARVKAEALRDAAQNMDEWNVEAIVVTGEEDDEDTWQEWTVADWLTNRADTIEKEAGA